MSDRREFTNPVKAEIRTRSNGACENQMMPLYILHLFPQGCPRPAKEIDHIYPDMLESKEAKIAPLTADEGADLCSVCHKIKTAEDQKARKRRNHHAVRDDRPKSGWFGNGRKLEGGGFDKTKTRGFDGVVRERKT
jgi:hypothetical protein